MKDFLGQEIKIGDSIVYVTSNSGYLEKGVVIKIASKKKNRYGYASDMVQVKGESNSLPGYTYPRRIIVIKE